MPDVIRVNNQPYNWNSSASKFDNQIWPGVTSVNVGDKLDVKTVYSQTQNGKPMGGTAGKYEVNNFKIKMLRDSADALTTYLSLKPPFIGSYGRTEFSYFLTVSEPLLIGVLPLVLVAGVCRVIEVNEATEEGLDELVSELTLWCKGVIRNGKTLYSNKLPGLP